MTTDTWRSPIQARRCPAMRRLIYVPIISRAEALEQASIGHFGAELWAEGRRVTDEIWEGIRVRLLSLPVFPWERVRIYQDGLTVSGEELQMAPRVAVKNYKLLSELVGRGGRLMGTESSELLRREYTHTKRIAEAATEAEREEARQSYAAETAKILKARDAFIARRIAETLEEGELGILFLGELHQVDRLLPDEGIQVEYLIDRVPLREAAER